MNELEEIMSRGHWRLTIRPSTYQRDRLKDLAACKDLVEQCQVNLRGWPFPYFRRELVVAKLDAVEMPFSSERVPEVEFWRLYLSGQFVHLSKMIEEYPRGLGYGGDRVFGVLGALYLITEYYEFAARIAERKLLADGATVEFRITDTNGRRLIMGDSGRHLSSDYVCRLDQVVHSCGVSEADLLGRAKDLAMDALLFVLERFNWDRPSRDMLSEDQRTFLQRRFLAHSVS